MCFSGPTPPKPAASPPPPADIGDATIRDAAASQRRRQQAMMGINNMFKGATDKALIAPPQGPKTLLGR